MRSTRVSLLPRLTSVAALAALVAGTVHHLGLEDGPEPMTGGHWPIDDDFCVDSLESQ